MKVYLICLSPSVNASRGPTDLQEHTLTLCAVLQQRLGHLEPQRAALTRRLPRHLQALRRSSAVKNDGVDHRQIIPEEKTQTTQCLEEECILSLVIAFLKTQAFFPITQMGRRH